MEDERKRKRERMMECIKILEGSKLDTNAANIDFLEQNWGLVDKHKSAYCQCNGERECFVGQFLSGKITSQRMQKVKNQIIKPTNDIVAEKVEKQGHTHLDKSFPDKLIIRIITETLNKIRNNTSDMFTLLKDDDGVEKFTLEIMTKVYSEIYPSLEDWQVNVLYFMRSNPEFEKMINEISDATPETRKEFYDLVKSQSFSL